MNAASAAVSIIVLHHDKAAYSRACLESLLVSTLRPLEVLNVDNGSRDETPAVLDAWEREAAARGVGTRRLNFQTNIGAVRGRNEAIKLATGNYLVFLDNDTLVFQPDWLERLVFHLEVRPDCGIVVPKLLFPWAPFDIECCGCGVTRTGRIQYIGRGQARRTLQVPQVVQCAISAAWMMPRYLTEKVGLLNENYSPVQYEDIDFCYQTREAGFTVETAPSVELFHFEHTTTAGSDDINFRYVTSKNAVAFKKCWREIFSAEKGPSEANAQWLELEKHGIEDVNWRALVQGTF